MLFKNIIRIIISYKFSLLPLIFFETIYLLKGFKGNKINFSKNKMMSDNIPCPYFFLIKIKKALEPLSFKKFIDLGCGSGRVINFFNESFPNKSFVGIEYFSEQYNYCKKNFINNSNIKIFQSDFTKDDFLKYDADCYFLNNPWKNEIESFNFIVRTTKLLSKKNILIILVNYSKKIVEKLNEELKNSQYIGSYYVNYIKGYYILKLNSEK
jgi:SAM-dependent methyltransferase